MHPTLFLIPRTWAGYPLFGLGILLALWLVGWGGYLAWLVWRRGWTDDVRGHLPFVIVGALVIGVIAPRIGDERGLPIRGYGVMLLVALVAGLTLTLRRARRLGLDPELMYSLLFWLAVPGVIGARLFYVVEYWEDFRGATWGETLANVAQITEGGLVVYGSAIAAAGGLFAFAWLHRLPALALADLIAPAGALAMGIGRIGCFLNGCCYGGATDLPWAVTFPFGSPPYFAEVRSGQTALWGIWFDDEPTATASILRVDPDSPAARVGLTAGQIVVKVERRPIETVAQAQAALVAHARPDAELLVWTMGDPVARWMRLPGTLPPSRPVHPAQLYSAIDGMLLAWVLWAFTPWHRRDGAVFALYLCLYPVSRFLQEIIRTDEGAIGSTGLTISQNVSLAILAVGVILALVVARRPAGLAWPERLTPAAG